MSVNLDMCMCICVYVYVCICGHGIEQGSNINMQKNKVRHEEVVSVWQSEEPQYITSLDTRELRPEKPNAEIVLRIGEEKKKERKEKERR